MTQDPAFEQRLAPARSATLDELRAQQAARPVEDLDELRVDLFEGHDELEDFLATLQAWRSAET